jgi:hypothetical protein
VPLPSARACAFKEAGVSCRDNADGTPMNDTRLTLRVDFGSNRSIGPGKVRLLETIDNTGSISQAGRALGVSYRAIETAASDAAKGWLDDLEGSPKPAKKKARDAKPRKVSARRAL